MLTGILTPCPHIRLTQETTGGHSVSPSHSRSKGQRRKQTNRHKSYPFFSYITDCQISSSQLTRILPTEENFLVKFQHHDSLTSVEFFKVWNWNICCCDLLTAVPRIKYMYNWAIKYFDSFSETKPIFNCLKNYFYSCPIAMKFSPPTDLGLRFVKLCCFK